MYFILPNNTSCLVQLFFYVVCSKQDDERLFVTASHEYQRYISFKFGQTEGFLLRISEDLVSIPKNEFSVSY